MDVGDREHAAAMLPTANKIRQRKKVRTGGVWASGAWNIAGTRPSKGHPSQSSNTYDAFVREKDRGKDSRRQEKEGVGNHRKPEAGFPFHAKIPLHVDDGDVNCPNRTGPGWYRRCEEDAAQRNGTMLLRPSSTFWTTNRRWVDTSPLRNKKCHLTALRQLAERKIISDRNSREGEMPSSEAPTVPQSSPRTTAQVNTALTATPRANLTVLSNLRFTALPIVQP